ncbi:hypothetical protein BC830DRAFT_1123398 [Chytriomyces sp. MP71]|nr:hypothetical protein BC830DRAFT_1123398 [Chytriomyces sp. MP71]
MTSEMKEDTEKQVLLTVADDDAEGLPAYAALAVREKRRCPVPVAVRRLLLVAAIAFGVLVHHLPCARRGRFDPHHSKHLWLERNGTVDATPEAIVLHFSDRIDPATLSLRYHKYVSNHTADSDGLGAWQEYNGHHNGMEAGNHSRNDWFTRCEPESTENGVAVFGSSCFDVAADLDQIQSGQRLTYALVAFAKKERKHDHHDNADDDDDEEEDEKAELIEDEVEELFGEDEDHWEEEHHHRHHHKEGKKDKRHNHHHDDRDKEEKHGHKKHHEGEHRGFKVGKWHHKKQGHRNHGPVGSHVNHRKYAVLVQKLVLIKP